MPTQHEHLPDPPPLPRRRVVYCVVPRELATRLYQPLAEHFAGREQVEVIIGRRAASEEAGAGPAADAAGSWSGRERRAPAAEPAEPPELPRRARRHAGRIAFLERLEPTEEAEDRDAERLVARFQAGEREVFAALYIRYFDRVYGYMRVLLRDAHEAEDATQQAFTQILHALPGYEQRGRPFGAWLFTVARNQAISELRRHGREQATDPAELGDGRPQAGPAAGEDQALEELALGWIRDRDLLVLLGRLPLQQRQVLALRYTIGMKPREIAELLSLSPNHVSVLQYRALEFLRKRLTALGREPSSALARRERRTRLQRCNRQARVLRRRRYVLSE